MKEYFGEISTIVLAVIAGIWTLVKALTYIYDKLQTRITKLENESITRREVQEWVSEMRRSILSQQDHLDKKLDAMNENIVRLMLRDRIREYECECRGRISEREHGAQ